MVVKELDFTYDGMDKPVLKKFDLDLPKGSRWDGSGGVQHEQWWFTCDLARMYLRGTCRRLRFSPLWFEFWRLVCFRLPKASITRPILLKTSGGQSF